MILYIPALNDQTDHFRIAGIQQSPAERSACHVIQIFGIVLSVSFKILAGYLFYPGHVVVSGVKRVELSDKFGEKAADYRTAHSFAYFVSVMLALQQHNLC